MLLGIACGAFLGMLVYHIIHSITGYTAVWPFYVCIVVFVLAGGMIAWKRGEWCTLFATSIIGGYLFMRGLTEFFGKYPSESTMFAKAKNGTALAVSPIVWVYYAVFVIACIFFYLWQTKLWGKEKKSEKAKQSDDDSDDAY